ncbi:hypothetical protein JZ751_011926 [Albula glossodonta]|uniref:Uncharacterized protein n=1 Tax=Albula glossodonta TaxID=121402 RepID=A0A8T2PQY6_9TELE|nr:hypothetical protein JZ751_011926 [Albula glossodonta]
MHSAPMSLPSSENQPSQSLHQVLFPKDKRMARTGITITTSEAVLLQLVADKDHPKFKEIQNIIKASAPESGLLSKLCGNQGGQEGGEYQSSLKAMLLIHFLLRLPAPDSTGRCLNRKSHPAARLQCSLLTSNPCWSVRYPQCAFAKLQMRRPPCSFSASALWCVKGSF